MIHDQSTINELSVKAGADKCPGCGYRLKDGQNQARYLHSDLGLLLYDIAELLGVSPNQVAAWLDE